MSVIYISSMFENDDLNNVFSNPNKVSCAANKYNRLLAEGIACNGIKTNVLAALPITKENCSRVFIKKRLIKDNNITIQYLSVINIPVLKNVVRVFQAFFHILFAPRDTFIVYDVFQKSFCIGMFLAVRIKKHPIYCILTDLPQYMGDVGKECNVDWITQKLINSSDGYIVITDQMRSKIPCDRKPTVVIEGLSKVSDTEVSVNSNDIRIVLYAGALHIGLGIPTLIQAFISCHKENEQLHLYGSGDYVQYLNEIVKNNNCIKYFGTVSNDTILQKEREASLLVNPRTDNGEYTKYSFPSKIMEYMGSGTPVLMAKLPGIPEEYYDYCYLFNEKDVNGLCFALRNILDKQDVELTEMGIRAQNFVLVHKNYIIQAKKAIDSFNLV